MFAAKISSVFSTFLVLFRYFLSHEAEPFHIRNTSKKPVI